MSAPVVRCRQVGQVPSGLFWESVASKLTGSYDGQSANPAGNGRGYGQRSGLASFRDTAVITYSDYHIICCRLWAVNRGEANPPAGSAAQCRLALTDRPGDDRGVLTDAEEQRRFPLAQEMHPNEVQTGGGQARPLLVKRETQLIERVRDSDPVTVVWPEPSGEDDRAKAGEVEGLGC